jgi:uncharacterized protein (TIRG00374 family)
MVVLINVVGAGEVLAVFRQAHLGWLALGLFCFIPQFYLIAWRWCRMTRPFMALSLAESVRIVLATNTANVVLPSKLGDLGKGLILARTGKVRMDGAMGLVIFEKVLDVATLAVYMILGTCLFLFAGRGIMTDPIQSKIALVALLAGLALLFLVVAIYQFPKLILGFLGADGQTGSASADQAGEASSGQASNGFKSKLIKTLQGIRLALQLLNSHGASPAVLVFTGLALWALHLIQILLFFWAVGAEPTLGQFLSMAPLAIFVGLVPITFGGFGTRDAALIAFFAPIPQATMLAAALLVNTRYVVPALAGLPFFQRYVSKG